MASLQLVQLPLGAHQNLVLLVIVNKNVALTFNIFAYVLTLCHSSPWTVLQLNDVVDSKQRIGKNVEESGTILEFTASFLEPGESSPQPYNLLCFKSSLTSFIICI